jgi:hypothetical protein
MSTCCGELVALGEEMVMVPLLRIPDTFTFSCRPESMVPDLGEMLKPLALADAVQCSGDPPVLAIVKLTRTKICLEHTGIGMEVGFTDSVVGGGPLVDVAVGVPVGVPEAIGVAVATPPIAVAVGPEC